MPRPATARTARTSPLTYTTARTGSPPDVKRALPCRPFPLRTITSITMSWQIKGRADHRSTETAVRHRVRGAAEPFGGSARSPSPAVVRSDDRRHRSDQAGPASPQGATTWVEPLQRPTGATPNTYNLDISPWGSRRVSARRQPSATRRWLAQLKCIGGSQPEPVPRLRHGVSNLKDELADGARRPTRRTRARPARAAPRLWGTTQPWSCVAIQTGGDEPGGRRPEQANPRRRQAVHVHLSEPLELVPEPSRWRPADRAGLPDAVRHLQRQRQRRPSRSPTSRRSTSPAGPARVADSRTHARGTVTTRSRTTTPA